MIGWLQAVGVALIVAGVALTFVTALGMIRLSSLFARMHAATKPQVLGVVLMCGGLALVMQRANVAATLLLVVMMQFIVAPISAHMLGRATYRLGQQDDDAIIADEYGEDIERARQHLVEDGRTDYSATDPRQRR